MTKEIHFYNNGSLDPRSFKILGMSAKAEEGSIGQFGTGLKYAIAGILRLGGKISIETVGKRYEFASVPATMRDKSFNLVTCNGEELSYTTEHGKRWEAWQYFRELHSNALDEGGDTVEGNRPTADTVITVECEEIAEAFENKGLYFLPSAYKPILETEDVQIFERISDSLFVKGVRVGSTDSAFSFNHLSDKVDLTEDRTLKYGHQHRELAARAINSCENEALIKRLIKDKVPSFSYVAPSDKVLSVAEKLLSKNPNVELCCGLKTQFIQIRGGLKRKEIPFTDYEQGKLARVLNFLKTIGYEVTAPIKIVEAEGDELYGQAKDGEIHLTKKSFEHGVHDLAQTVLEEHAHLITGHGDETRALQQWLFRQVIVMGEKSTGQYL